MRIQDLFDLTGKVSVVTGGSGYLGKAICEGLSESGAEVYVAGRRLEKCKKVARDIGVACCRTLRAIDMDITNSSSVRKAYDTILEESGRIDILVNNAVYSSGGKLFETTEEDWMHGIDGTIHGVFRCTKEVISAMKRQRSSSIINIASMYGIVSPDPSIYANTGFDNPPSYGAGKAAILQFTRYCACHLASCGIRVNAISPGTFPNSDVAKNRWFLDQLKAKNPMKRVGQPYELKGAVVFLASEAASYVTGTNLVVDGGWTAW